MRKKYWGNPTAIFPWCLNITDMDNETDALYDEGFCKIHIYKVYSGWGILRNSKKTIPPGLEYYYKKSF